MSTRFRIHSPYQPAGDQPEAIERLCQGIAQGHPYQTLLGATGTGKTFTMANVIERTQRPALILSHNKTLAAQLFEEMKALFPENAVSYFVSYYDYFQPEAYLPARDIYIEKDSSRNADLDRLRLATTSNLLHRDDSVVVASVSCIYGLGSPEEYANRSALVTRGAPVDRTELLMSLCAMQYSRNDAAPERGNYRVRGECIEVWPAYAQHAIRIDLADGVVERVERFDSLTGEGFGEEDRAYIFPAVHYMMPRDQLDRAIKTIREEMTVQVAALQGQGKLLEAQRLMGRTRYDLEMLTETGTCAGIENYSRHMEGRDAGSRGYCLLDYFRRMPGRASDEWLVFVDESHVTLPQLRGMHAGDRARKETLVTHGFRLPSALDNRPLMFSEWESLIPQCVFVSATPSRFELERSGGLVAEQIIRPTGLLDPPVEVRSAREQVPDILREISIVAQRGLRTLVTALTKRLCEELTRYLDEAGVRVRYLHSDIETLERLEILRDLREGAFDVLVGVNLLREGLDLPEVALVCILDADRQGFLRSEASLIQTMGRAARNSESRCILYADRMTPEMQRAIDEIGRRRTKQIAHNLAHGIVPTTVVKSQRRALEGELASVRDPTPRKPAPHKILRAELLEELESEMAEAAKALQFERAAHLRDEALRVRAMVGESVEVSEPDPSATKDPPPGSAKRRSGRRWKNRR
ncbi:MAG: excinuclease ABC subunit UvrB [Phycisphaerales bacterium]|nr:excinuclease ABC subunit UvrB [Phycisphaerales bacterium]